MNNDNAAISYQKERINHWNNIAPNINKRSIFASYYHKRLAEVYKHLVAPNQRILEFGCGEGDLLSALKPSYGVGIDFAPAMIEQAKNKHPKLQFVTADVHDFETNEKFDIIILSDLVHDLWDVQKVFSHLAKFSTPRTRVIINTYSRLWELPLAFAKFLGLAKPMLHQNWLTVEDITGFLYLENFELIRVFQEMLLPLNIPFITPLLNRILVKLFPFYIFALTNLIIARPIPARPEGKEKKLVSVIVPARNEEGNITQILARVPEIGAGTELVFVEGNSRDKTYEAIEKAIVENPNRKCKLLKQTGVGKGDAVRMGFSNASGDILMILDADLTVPPEDLPRFYDAIASGKGEFINGVRLVYPMEKEAMRFFNLIGNKFFSLAFSWLLGQPIKDTLCGTKVLRKEDYNLISNNRSYFGDFDPFGDFDLLFGAAKLNMKIVEIPIRYRERTYGTTNIDRWRHGWLLQKMLLFAIRRLKFV